MMRRNQVSNAVDGATRKVQDAARQAEATVKDRLERLAERLHAAPAEEARRAAPEALRTERFEHRLSIMRMRAMGDSDVKSFTRAYVWSKTPCSRMHTAS